MKNAKLVTTMMMIMIISWFDEPCLQPYFMHRQTNKCVHSLIFNVLSEVGLQEKKEDEEEGMA